MGVEVSFSICGMLLNVEKRYVPRLDVYKIASVSNTPVMILMCQQVTQGFELA